LEGKAQASVIKPNITRTGKLLSVGESEIKNLRAPLSMKVQLVAPIAAIC
jgi:hypothetical protein